MSVKLTDWLPNEARFLNRESSVAVLRLLLEKQQATLALGGASVANPMAYGAAHYPQPVAQVEHLARLMWGSVPAGEEMASINIDFAQKIAQGCDPHSCHYWGVPTNYDQRVVEMASFAAAMIDAPSVYWDTYNDGQKRNVLTWFASVQGLQLPPNNWRWFRILIVNAIELLGGQIDRPAFEADLDFIDQHYLGDGWYQDGPTAVMDYYNPFAFHLYALMFVRWNRSACESPSVDKTSANKSAVLERCSVLLQRAVQFAHSYQVWFGDNGSQLCYGRSLNYRFASAAFWAELAHFDLSELSAAAETNDNNIDELSGVELSGVAKGHRCPDMAQLRSLWASNVRWWAEQPIWDQQGQLLSGFAYPNLLASEFYTSPVSPFLAYKAFAALRLPSEHPFWQSEEHHLPECIVPQWVNDQHFIWRQGGSYLLTNAPASGELRHCYDKYSKFAYSSEHGLCVESERWLNQGFAGDNMLAFQHPETQTWHSRQQNLHAYRQGDSLVSVWRPFAGCEVTTRQTWLGNHEQRQHQITSDRPLKFVMTGYAVDAWRPWFSHLETSQPSVVSERLYSTLVVNTPIGEETQSPLVVQGAIYPCAPNTNLLYAHACVPALVGDVTQGCSTLEVNVFAGRTTIKTPFAEPIATQGNLIDPISIDSISIDPILINPIHNSHQGVTDEQ